MEAVRAPIVNRSAPAKAAAVVQRQAAPTVQRSSAVTAVQPSLQPAALQRPTLSSAPRALQLASKVSSPSDPAEKEAEATAKRIMRMAAPEAVRPVPPTIQRFVDRATVHPQGAAPPAKAESAPAVTPAISSEISAATSSGNPMPAPVRSFMEPRFQADFSAVRLHTDDRAARLSSQLGAAAFTVGNHVFFGAGHYQPESAGGRELIAHELTHTVQQGAVVQRAVAPEAGAARITQSSPPMAQRLGISDALNYFADAANNIPGYRMFTIVLGVNPINMSRVDRSAANILRAVVEFMPGGGLITRALDNYGVFDRAGAFIEQQLRSLGITGGVIRDALNRFLDSLSWRDIFRLGSVWDRARRIFSEPVDRIITFVRNLAGAILTMIKDAILRPLAGLASRTRAWDLLIAVLGRNPITGDPVPRTAETLIGGFMRLIGQEEIWQNIQRSGAIGRAWTWFQGALNGLIGFVREIPSLFIRALQALSIDDLVQLPTAFGRVVGVFGDFFGRFFSWAGGTIWSLLEIIFDVVAPGVMPYLRRAAGAFRSILQNPIGFVGNLVRAGATGLRQFASNFLRHLRASLIGWLTGAMSGAGLYIPQAFNLQEIIKFVLSVLGLTWQNIRTKLVRVLGETAVRALETGFDLVMTLVTQGPAAAWQKILEGIQNLQQIVIEGVMTFVRDRIVTAAITRLVSMLNPAGAFIQAIIATYNTVMFFVERLRQIIQVATAFMDSIMAIASGNITAAANRVETVMAGLLTLVISFLARIAGLGRVSDAVTNIINRVRQPIDRALDRVVDWIVAQARRLGRLVTGGAQGGPQDPVRAAVAEATGLLRRQGVTLESVQAQIPTLRTRFNIRRLELIVDRRDGSAATVHVRGENSPGVDGETVTIAPSVGLIVGPHPVTGPSGRESHHVPPNESFQVLRRYIAAQGARFQALSAPAAKSAGARLSGIASGHDVGDGGNGLPAILVDVGTHRTAGMHAHSRQVADHVNKLVVKYPNVFSGVASHLPRTGTGLLSANPRTRHWEDVANRVDTTNRTTERMEGAETMSEREILEVVRESAQAYHEAAKTYGRAQIMTALRNSTKDGTEEERNRALRELASQGQSNSHWKAVRLD